MFKNDCLLPSKTFYQGFSLFISDTTTGDEIMKWWNKINFAYDEIFNKVSIGRNNFLSKEELQAPNSSITLLETNSNFGRCFSFEVLISLDNAKLFDFEFNMTQIDALWCYVHDKYDKLGFYNNFWLR